MDFISSVEGIIIFLVIWKVWLKDLSNNKNISILCHSIWEPSQTFAATGKEVFANHLSISIWKYFLLNCCDRMALSFLDDGIDYNPLGQSEWNISLTFTNVLPYLTAKFSCIKPCRWKEWCSFLACVLVALKLHSIWVSIHEWQLNSL